MLFKKTNHLLTANLGVYILSQIKRHKHSGSYSANHAFNMPMYKARQTDTNGFSCSSPLSENEMRGRKSFFPLMNLDMSFTLCCSDLMQNDSLSLIMSFYQAIIMRELQSTSIPLSRSLNAVLLQQLRVRIWLVCVCVGGSACCVGDMGWLFVSRLMLRPPDRCRIDRIAGR